MDEELLVNGCVVIGQWIFFIGEWTFLLEGVGREVSGIWSYFEGYFCWL